MSAQGMLKSANHITDVVRKEGKFGRLGLGGRREGVDLKCRRDLHSQGRGLEGRKDAERHSRIL